MPYLTLVTSDTPGFYYLGTVRGLTIKELAPCNVPYGLVLLIP